MIKTFVDDISGDVAGCLTYSGSAKTDQDIEAAMKKAARKAWRDRN